MDKERCDQETNGVVIRSFRASDENAFRTLNEQWIKEYFQVEAKDLVVLNDPKGAILDAGGYILLAEIGNQPVGCCALLPMGERAFELSKLAVAPEYRGTGTGRKLVAAVIEKARQLGAQRLYLETNRVLIPARKLYESFGFRELAEHEVTPSPYKRADVHMELLLR
jgi:putative acetyltransferase